jgi:hypothetical protein
VKTLKVIGKWILMILFLWLIGTVLGVVFELGFAMNHIILSDFVLGSFVLLFIIFGLIIYGATRK